MEVTQKVWILEVWDVTWTIHSHRTRIIHTVAFYDLKTKVGCETVGCTRIWFHLKGFDDEGLEACGRWREEHPFRQVISLAAIDFFWEGRCWRSALNPTGRRRRARRLLCFGLFASFNRVLGRRVWALESVAARVCREGESQVHRVRAWPGFGQVQLVRRKAVGHDHGVPSELAGEEGSIGRVGRWSGRPVSKEIVDFLSSMIWAKVRQKDHRRASFRRHVLLGHHPVQCRWSDPSVHEVIRDGRYGWV